MLVKQHYIVTANRGISELVRSRYKRRLTDYPSGQQNATLHNPKKTEVVLLATPEMSRAHGLDKLSIDLSANGRELDGL